MDARVAAAKALDEVSRQGRSLNTVLPIWQSRVVARDTPLLQELVFGTLRWYMRLEAIAVQLLHKPFKAKDNDVYALILLGLYQMQYLRVPDHAAVSATVAATKALKKPWARGLVNAVLRGFQRDSEAILATLDDDPVKQFSHPVWLVQQLQSAYPQYWQMLLDANNQRPPMCLRINKQQTNRQEYCKHLAATGLQASELQYSEQGLQLLEATDVEALPGFSEGQFSVQDGAAQLAAGLLAAQPGERILDACAAPGGKTAHVLELQPQLAEIVALDNDAARLERVKQNMLRLRLSASLMCADAACPDRWWDGRLFDRIMLDAPCSATGVIRRHPDIKLLRRESDIDALVRVQGQILCALWPLLKPGGMLLYMTCSVLPQENVQQLHKFCAANDDVEHLPIEAEWGMTQAVGRQILTGQDGMDGFYFACLRKKDITE